MVIGECKGIPRAVFASSKDGSAVSDVSADESILIEVASDDS